MKKTARKIAPLEMFLGFSSVGLRGFGGVMPFVYDELVERRQWITAEDFSEMIALGQVLPGANVTNFAAMFGYRMAGWTGVFAAVGGLLGPPALVMIALYFFYSTYANFPVVQGALRGITAVAAALVFVTGVKMIYSQRSGRYVSLVFAAAALVAVGFFSLPLLGVLVVLAPLLFIVNWRRAK